MSWLCPWCWYTSLCSSVHGAALLLHCCCSVQGWWFLFVYWNSVHGTDFFLQNGLCPWCWFPYSDWNSVHGADFYSTTTLMWCWFQHYHPLFMGLMLSLFFSEWDGFLYFCFSGNDFYNTAAAWTCWWLEHYQNPFIMLHDADFNKSIALSVVLKFSPIIIPILLHSTACVYFLVKSIQYVAANL